MIMLTNAEIKKIRSLKEKKFRDEYGLFVVEGEKLVQEALNSDFEVVAVYRIEEIGEAAMAKISLTSSPSPVLAVVAKPGLEGSAVGRGGLTGNGGFGNMSEAAEEHGLPEGLSLALDSVRDPGNLGTIIRIADWFGVETVFVSSDTVEAYNPKVVQATMGSIFRVRVVEASIPELCRAYKAAGKPVYGTLLDGGNIYDAKLGNEGLIVMGNESNGISQEVRRELSAGLLIPSFGKSGAESLNVGVATALTLSEFRRR